MIVADPKAPLHMHDVVPALRQHTLPVRYEACGFVVSIVDGAIHLVDAPNKLIPANNGAHTLSTISNFAVIDVDLRGYAIKSTVAYMVHRKYIPRER